LQAGDKTGAGEVHSASGVRPREEWSSRREGAHRCEPDRSESARGVMHAVGPR
jgi:hypothetical protein